MIKKLITWVYWTIYEKQSSRVHAKLWRAWRTRRINRCTTHDFDLDSEENFQDGIKTKYISLPINKDGVVKEKS
jgi:hypothetical protein